MNTRKNRKTIVFSCVISLLLLGGIVYYWQIANKDYYCLEVIRTDDNGYGYQICDRGRTIIRQPFIPAISGKRSFLTEQDAKSVGSLVLKRVRAGEDFTVSREDLEKLKIDY